MSMGRLITLAVAVASILLIWKGGVLNSVLPQQAAPPLDPGPVISKSGDAMQSLKSVHLTLNGTLVLSGVAGVKITGSGDLIYPHKENLSLQLEIPAANGQTAILAMNERIEGGHEYVQYPSQGDPGKYVSQLKADPNSGLTPQDEAALTNAGIQTEVWISASDSLMHQMKIDMTTTQFTWTLTYHFSNFVTGGGSTST